MRLDGSCQCGKVTFSVDSETPYPYMNCYCSICRKCTGGAYGVNIMGKRATLKVRGEKYLRDYHARMRAKGKKTTLSEGTRVFCGECGTHLYLLDDRWPEGVWPNASAIDTELPEPPERAHVMMNYKPAWVIDAGDGPRFKEYPKLSIADWHSTRGLTVTGAKPKRAGKKRTAKKRAKA
jgi:hypothetical protein